MFGGTISGEKKYQKLVLNTVLFVSVLSTGAVVQKCAGKIFCRDFVIMVIIINNFSYQYWCDITDIVVNDSNKTNS